jgi:hypothetical protein
MQTEHTRPQRTYKGLWLFVLAVGEEGVVAVKAAQLTHQEVAVVEAGQ